MSNGDTCRFCGDPALEAKIAELEKIRDAAQVVADERHSVDSGYELFARVNILKLSALAKALEGDK